MTIFDYFRIFCLIVGSIWAISWILRIAGHSLVFLGRIYPYLVALALLLGAVAYVRAGEGVAVLPWTGLPAQEGESLSALFSQSLTKLSGIRPLVRSEEKLRQISQELAFQAKGLSSGEKRLRAGEALNARYLVSGELKPLGQHKTVTVSVLDAEKFSVKGAVSKVVQTVEDIPPLLDGIAEQVSTWLMTDDTPLLMQLLAAYTGRRGISEIKSLVTRDINAAGSDGNTALMIAAKEGYTEVAEALIKEGANVNAQNIRKATPLMFAAQDGHSETVRLLLLSGAIKDLKSDGEYEAVSLAKENGHKDTAEIIRKFPKQEGL